MRLLIMALLGIAAHECSAAALLNFPAAARQHTTAVASSSRRRVPHSPAANEGDGAVVAAFALVAGAMQARRALLD